MSHSSAYGAPSNYIDSSFSSKWTATQENGVHDGTMSAEPCSLVMVQWQTWVQSPSSFWMTTDTLQEDGDQVETSMDPGTLLHPLGISTVCAC